MTTSAFCTCWLASPFSGSFRSSRSKQKYRHDGRPLTSENNSLQLALGERGSAFSFGLVDERCDDKKELFLDNERMFECFTASDSFRAVESDHRVKQRSELFQLASTILQHNALRPILMETTPSNFQTVDGTLQPNLMGTYLTDKQQIQTCKYISPNQPILNHSVKYFRVIQLLSRTV